MREYFFGALTEEEKTTIAEASRKVLDRINPPICGDELADAVGALDVVDASVVDA